MNQSHPVLSEQSSSSWVFMIRVRGDVDVPQRERASSTNVYSNKLICITDIPQKENFQQEARLFNMFRCFEDTA